jgi:tetratricopeptide (TPR) repeat protein
MARDIFRSGAAGGDGGVKKTLAAAIQQLGNGRPDEAVRLLESETGAALKTHVGQNILGDILLKQGKHKEALRAFDTAIRFMPSAPEAYCNRGVALQELGRLEEALAAEDRAIRLRPEYGTAHFNRGNVLKALERFDDAVAAYGRAVKTQSQFAEAFLNRGLSLLELNRPMEALADFNRVLGIRPNFASAHVGRAGAYRDLGQHDDALAAIDAAENIDPGNVEAAHLRCSTLFAAERYAESLAAADTLVARNVEDAEAHRARAVALVKLQRPIEALAAVDEAVRLAPGDDEVWTTRGIVFGEMGLLAESLEALDEARRLGASGKAFFHARAVALAALGDPEEALADFEKTLAIDPKNFQAHYNLAFLKLVTGDWKDGWAEHEWRLKAREHHHNALVQTAPKWEGQPLGGKRLLVYAEQGLGDTIQFVRYLRLIEKSGAEITLVVPEPIRRLFDANFPTIDVTASTGMRTGFDYQISLMSMAHAFASTLETLPAAVPYLFADAERVARWRERIGTDGFRVGIVWQGSLKYPRDRERSIRLAEYAPLGRVPGVRLISVQSIVGLDQLNALPEGMRVETLGEEVVANPDGFREVAAVMANLDLLIMSDTGPTHLAGALGRPVWLALARHADWRWMRDREDSPWYPTMRLFRQKTAGDWPEVFGRVARELAQVARRG